MRCTVLPFGVLVLVMACTMPEKRPSPGFVQSPVVITRSALGVRFQLALFGEREKEVVRLAEEIFGTVEQVDAHLNNWREESSISRLNEKRGMDWQAVHPELAAALLAAVSMSHRTGGVVDVTVGPLLEAWGFVERKLRQPSPEVLLKLRERVGIDLITVTLSPSGVRRSVDGVTIDLSSLAKGWAVDRAVEHLRSVGVEQAFVAAGSSTVYALGKGPEGKGWPFVVAPGREWRLIDEAVSTSGKSEQDLTQSGERFAHILDPRSGRPVETNVVRAIFAGPSATEADMASTALVVMGPEEAQAWFMREGWTHGERRALLAIEQDDGLVTWMALGGN
ncbi:MAG: FAD:protein FMN transferase [Planctomycetota bacterium]|nr:FAD:protein FMN transferase [Planctomycetota bacterium]